VSTAPLSAGHPLAPVSPGAGVPLVSLVAVALHARQAVGALSVYDRSVVLRFGRFAGVASAAAAAELAELVAACPVPRAGRARRRRVARRCTSTIRAGADPPPSENADTPGSTTGGVAQNIGSMTRVRLTCRRPA
jgi:hypothetical protein